MLQRSPVQKSIDRKRDYQKLSECYSSSFAKKLKSFVENFVTDDNDKKQWEDNKSVDEDIHIDPIDSENIVESKDK